jgi:hypothetical protein
LDVADEGGDKNAFCFAHGVVIEHLSEWSGKDSDIAYTVQRAFTLCDELGCQSFLYDSDGLGAGVRGDARLMNERRAVHTKIEVTPFRGSAAVFRPEAQDVKGRKNEDYFANAKAQAWWSLRTRFQKTYRMLQGEATYSTDELISIPSKLPLRNRLVSELSQPTWSPNLAGKIVIDKAPDGMKSPNLADSVMMRFSPVRRPMHVSAELLARA